jgi:hypothetical protein
VKEGRDEPLAKLDRALIVDSKPLDDGRLVPPLLVSELRLKRDAVVEDRLERLLSLFDLIDPGVRKRLVGRLSASGFGLGWARAGTGREDCFEH